jgi:hypothetical protein
MLEGGCLCGATRYQVTDYDRIVHCHCGTCKKATGAAFATWVCIRLSLFRQLRGAATFRRSSPGCSRAFCAECGTSLFMKYDSDHEIAVSLGSLDDRARVSPDYSIWTSERLIWANCMDASLPQFRADPD